MMLLWAVGVFGAGFFWGMAVRFWEVLGLRKLARQQLGQVASLTRALRGMTETVARQTAVIAEMRETLNQQRALLLLSGVLTQDPRNPPD